MADFSASANKPEMQPDQQPSVIQITELAGGLAHELRNPLSTLMINLKLLAEDLQDLEANPEDARRRALLKVDRLTREAQRLQGLFDEFLNLTGPCQPQLARAALNEVIGRLVSFFEPKAASHNLQLEVASATEPLQCTVDEGLLRQALLNLLINAQQAMPEGGALQIKTSVECGEAVISISDTGVGIEERDRERIFRPFFSTKAGGSGLGLPITRRIVEAHGGRLECESEVGKGTTFTIHLPLANAGENVCRPEG